MKKFLVKNKKNKAFTLIETLVAVSILSLSILGLLSGLAGGITNISYIKQKIVATYLAQEGVESIRNMRDNYILSGGSASSNWANFKAKLAPCNSNNQCGLDNSVASSSNNFIFSCNAGGGNACKTYVTTGGNYNVNAVGVDSGLSRKLYAETPNSDEVRVYSTVEWMQGSGGKSVTFSEDLFNWVEK